MKFDNALFAFYNKSFYKKVRSKNPVGFIGLCRCDGEKKECASPQRDVYFVPRKHSAEPRGVGTLHRLLMVCKRAIGANLMDFQQMSPPRSSWAKQHVRVAESKRVAQTAQPFGSRGGKGEKSVYADFAQSVKEAVSNAVVWHLIPLLAVLFVFYWFSKGATASV